MKQSLTLHNHNRLPRRCTPRNVVLTPLKKIHDYYTRHIHYCAGFTHDRRSFLSLQIEIGKSLHLEELWENVCIATGKLEFDMAELHLCRRRRDEGYDGPERVTAGIPEKERRKKRNNGSFQWTRGDFDINQHLCGNALLKLELPLVGVNGSQSMGTLWLVKDLKRNHISHYTLRRVEHLRRTVISTLGKMKIEAER